MTKESAITQSIEMSAAGPAYVWEWNGEFYVNHDRVMYKGAKWLGTAKNGKFRTAANIRAGINRKAREDAMRSCGLVKVKGALGGTYWE